MKRLIIVMIGIVFFYTAKAQDSTSCSSKRSEINIGYFNIFNLTSINHFGIGYKYAIGNGALRIGSGFEYLNEEAKYNDTITNTSEGLTVAPRIGYEFRHNYKKLMTYYGFDFCGLIENQAYKLNFSNQNHVAYGVGLSPFIGVKYSFNKSISVSTETCFNFMYSWGSEKNTLNGLVIYERNIKDITAHLSPLGIVSINYHF